MKHGRGVDKTLGGVKTTRKSKCNLSQMFIYPKVPTNKITA